LQHVAAMMQAPETADGPFLAMDLDETTRPHRPKTTGQRARKRNRHIPAT
jgi:hypothetical protein